jgi:hypothetical protein
MQKVLTLNRYSGHILNMPRDFHRAECREEGRQDIRDAGIVESER